VLVLKISLTQNEFYCLKAVLDCRFEIENWSCKNRKEKEMSTKTTINQSPVTSYPLRTTNDQRRTNEPASEGTRLIELTWGKYAIVDAEDYLRLSSYKWCAVKEGRTWYAKTFRRDGMPLSMHRLITRAPKGLLVDHINHNGLNNRRSNLRLCTHKQNQRNRRPNRGGTSEYKGVHWSKNRKKFRAMICNNSKIIHLGYFQDETEAAKAYDKKAKELFGEFAYLNFTEESDTGYWSTEGTSLRHSLP